MRNRDRYLPNRGPLILNPGRRDGFLWNTDNYICPARVDGFRCDVRDATAAALVDDYANDPENRQIVESDEAAPLSLPRHEVALMDIARYAKPKGIAKEFEVLDAPRRVIVLSEDAFVDTDASADDYWVANDDSEWENIDAFADSDSDAATAQDYETDDDDYCLARRLQDEEYAATCAKHVRRVSVTRRRAYANVTASNG
ncbi:hypothetical protein B0H12DRAFT_294589 [Mycena haematopus]|nr:hypothetical protein B0H12DRAFT_294589 [Mycena haematopus]